MSNPLNELVDKSLDGFRIKECSEVYRVDEDGKRIGCIGVCFKNPALARVYRTQLADHNFYEIRGVFVLSNGRVSVRLDDPIPVSFADENALDDIRRKILEKLSADERTILGLT